MKHRPFLFTVLLSAALISISAPAYAATTVEYENLRSLLQEGSRELADATDSYNKNIEELQQNIAALEEERENMRFYRNAAEEGEEKSLYSQNVQNLTASLKQLRKQLNRSTARANSISVRKTIDQYELTAQTMMGTYNQLLLNTQAAEKAAEAAQKNYEMISRKRMVGAATDAAVAEAYDSLLKQQSLYDDYAAQTANARFQFLSCLGITNGEDVTIGNIPEPDLSLIDAIDFSADLTQAVNNNPSVQSSRQNNSGSMGQQALQNLQEAETVGSRTAEFTALYEQLAAQRLTYQAALDAFTAAEISYRSLQLKKQAGIVSDAAYIYGEAEYLDALAQKESASINLYQTYQNYLWERSGVSGGLSARQ